MEMIPSWYIYQIIIVSRILVPCCLLGFFCAHVALADDEVSILIITAFLFFSLVDSVASISRPKMAKNPPEGKWLAVFFTASPHFRDDIDRQKSILIGAIIFLCFLGALLKLSGVL